MMFYQSSESTGRADENIMRVMPWVEMMTLFKKAHKIEELKHTAKFPNAAGTNTKPPHTAQPTGQQQVDTPQHCGKCTLLGQICNPKWNHCRKPGHQAGTIDSHHSSSFRKKRNCEICFTGTQSTRRTPAQPPSATSAPVFYQNHPHPYGQNRNNTHPFANTPFAFANTANTRPPFPNNPRHHILPNPPLPPAHTPQFNTYQAQAQNPPGP